MMDIKYSNGWNLQRFMLENNDGVFDQHLITDYLLCTDLLYGNDDVEYMKDNGINDLTPYFYDAMETIE